jgi:fatty-acyl-CoA synthase
MAADTAPRSSKEGAAQAWLRALELTSSIPREPEVILLDSIQRRAATCPEAPALLSATECFSYRELIETSNRYARWALAHKLGRETTICLLMSNRPEYMAIWLGLSAAGCSVALLNTKLVGASLAHCISAVSASHIIVAADLFESMDASVALSGMSVATWLHGGARAEIPNIHDEVVSLSGDPLGEDERAAIAGGPVTIKDRALCIYTSGTTGLPKAVNISHGRIMQWSRWFAGLAQISTTDRLYNCLPMFHSVGGIVATGPLLTSGGAVIIGGEFSARQFWGDITRWDCTLFQYIGELCRYLLQTAPSPEQNSHHIRMCIGNGLRPEIWADFKSRFQIPRILEFYAATEGGVSLFNVEEEPGSLGRIPGYLAHRFPIELIQWDEHKEAPLRNLDGVCIRCAPDEIGEALAPIAAKPTSPGNAFEGYTDERATEKKILRNVFETGDAWFRTGDLMRRDARGYFYFVDRIGDTFRWKGENVSTTEVEQTICGCPGVRQACVYGVSIPRTDGRAGMAAILADTEFSLENLEAHLSGHLPEFARPIFLRLCAAIETTSTFRTIKDRFLRDGYDPAATTDKLFFRDRQARAYAPLDGAQFERIQTGRIIL